MSRKVLSIVLMAAVLAYPAAFFDVFETSSPDSVPCWSGESYEPAPDASTQASDKAQALAPVSVASVSPSETLLPQRPFFEDARLFSRLGGDSRSIRAPPLA